MSVLFAATPGALSAEQACEYLGDIAMSTLQGLEAQSLIVAVDVGGTKKFRRSDLDAYLANCADWAGRGGRNKGVRR